MAHGQHRASRLVPRPVSASPRSRRLSRRFRGQGDASRKGLAGFPPQEETAHSRAPVPQSRPALRGRARRNSDRQTTRRKDMSRRRGAQDPSRDRGWRVMEGVDAALEPRKFQGNRKKRVPGVDGAVDP
ncbi:MAG: hypothetical protein OXC66_12735 [Roseovarius sp.]|nr:hypothetical protein [Roseovarius sp.]